MRLRALVHLTTRQRLYRPINNATIVSANQLLFHCTDIVSRESEFSPSFHSEIPDRSHAFHYGSQSQVQQTAFIVFTLPSQKKKRNTKAILDPRYESCKICGRCLLHTFPKTAKRSSQIFQLFPNERKDLRLYFDAHFLCYTEKRYPFPAMHSSQRNAGNYFEVSCTFILLL